MRGAGATNATYAFGAENSSQTALFTVRNDGAVNVSNGLFTASAGIAIGSGYNATLVAGDVALVSNAGYGILSADATRAIAITNAGTTINDGLTVTTAGSSNTIVTNSAGYVGIGVVPSSYRLEVNGTIYTSSGGVRFPDGTTQTTAFTGTASVDANSLTGTTLASNVVNSSLTLVGTLTGLTVSGATPTFNTVNSTGTLTLGSTAAVSQEQRFRLINSNVTSGVELVLNAGGTAWGLYDRTASKWAMSITRGATDASNFPGSVSVTGALSTSSTLSASSTLQVSSYAAIGGSLSANAQLYVRGTMVGVGTNQYGVLAQMTFPVAATSGMYGIYVATTGAAGTYTTSDAIGINIQPHTLGAGQTVTNAYGLLLATSSYAATTKYGIAIGSVTGGSTNYAIYTNTGLVRFGDAVTMTGDLTVDTSTLKVDSANNRVGVGTASPAQTLDVSGSVNVRSASPTVFFDRNGSYTWRIANGDGTTYPLSSFNIANNAGTAAITITAANVVSIGGNTALHAGNYNSYAPTLTGGGASGTWGISVTGSASSASSASSATFADSGAVFDTRGSVTGPQTGGKRVRFDFLANSTDGLNDGGSYHGVMTFQQWGDASGGGTRQLGFTDNDNLWIRGSGSGLTSYNSWKLLLNSSNYSSYALPLSGGVLTGAVRGTQLTVGGGTNTDATFAVNGNSHIAPGSSFVYWGGTTGNVNSWSSREYSSGGIHSLNASRWILDRVGYGSQPLIDAQLGNITLGQYTTIESGARVNGGIRQGNNMARPLAEWSASGDSSGMVIFYLPGGSGNYGMVHMVFDIYEYTSNTVSTVIVGGHNWGSSWYNVGANVIGSTNKSVRLGFKNGQYCVVFGGAGSTWTYGTVVLRKIHNASFYNNIMDMGGSFTTTQTTTESFSSVTGDLRNLSSPVDITAGGAVYASNWFRSYGATGWYNQTYGGGIWMQDSTWVRVYGTKDFYATAAIAAVGNITAYYSDERLKTKVGDIDNALAKVRKLSGFLYVENELARKVGYKNTKQQVGVSAQRVREVLPEAVSLAPFDIETDSETGELSSKSGEEYLTVDYSRLVPLLIEAVKELADMVEGRH